MKILIPLLLITTSVFAAVDNGKKIKKDESVSERLARLYPNQKPEFIQERVVLAKKDGDFQTWRSFPPYFYDIVRRHPQKKVFSNRSGFCAGDAHVENFGFTQVAGPDGKTPSFSINDLDDAGVCKQDVDVMRLYIGHKLAKTNMSSADFIKTYQAGLSGNACPVPEYIKSLAVSENGREMKKDFKKGCPVSEEDGTSAVPKDSELENRLKAFNQEGCLDGTPEAGTLQELAVMEFAFACKQTKKTGGSAGETRYTVVLKNKAGVMEAYELKPLVKTAYDRGTDNRDSRHRDRDFSEAAEHFYGKEAKEYFKPLLFTNDEGVERLYQKRPLWEGNKGVKLSKIDAPPKSKDKPNSKEATNAVHAAAMEATSNSGASPKVDEVMKYETCVLGNLHGKGKKTKKNSFSPDPVAWEDAANNLSRIFKKEFELP